VSDGDLVDVGHREAVSFLLVGLHRLPSRGYDSAGIVAISGMSLET
jgi:glucosamine 6-phosphate synthetase-like amidotransferase/phosphosugar isomerase protein